MNEQPQKRTIQIKLVPANEYEQQSVEERCRDREAMGPVKAATTLLEDESNIFTESKIVGELDPLAIEDHDLSTEYASKLNDNLDSCRVECGRLWAQAVKAGAAAVADLAAAKRNALIKIYVACNTTTNTAADAASSDIGKNVISRLIVECVITAVRMLS